MKTPLKMGKQRQKGTVSNKGTEKGNERKGRKGQTGEKRKEEEREKINGKK